MHAHPNPTLLPVTLPPPTSPTRAGSPIPIDSRSEGSLMAENYAHLCTTEESNNQRQVTSIDTLPDDVLLKIFHHNVCDPRSFQEKRQTAWQSLVHVCCRWRAIVFGSPRHLDLQLVFTERTRARDILNVWPTLPLSVSYHGFWVLHRTNKAGSLDNTIAGLEHTDRVRRIMCIDLLGSDLAKLLVAMQKPFPNLTHLGLWSARVTTGLSQALSIDLVDFVVPNSFLSESATRLRDLSLRGIPFPGLPKLLLSATHLDNLFLDDIPHSGYFSPDAMVNVLTTLTSLTTLVLKFQSPLSCPDQTSRRLPTSTRTVLPVLTALSFQGANEYLEDLVAHIVAPKLMRLFATFFNDIKFDPPQFLQFITRTPMSRTLDKAHVTLRDGVAAVDFMSRTPAHGYGGKIDVKILCRGLDRQVSSLGQVSTMCLPRLSTLETLYICKHPSLPLESKEIKNGLWLKLLQPFTAVKDLHLSKECTSHLAPVLLELVEGRTTEVLPALQNIFLEGLDSSGPVNEGIGQFAAARQVAGRPIAISPWANYKT